MTAHEQSITCEGPRKQPARRGGRVLRGGAPLVRHHFTGSRRSIYFIQGEVTGLIKIGLAIDVRARLKDLQQGSPDRLSILGVMLCHQRGALERELHRRFDDCRAHGEWFEPRPALLAFIAEHAKSIRIEDEAFERDLRAALEKVA